MRTFLIDCWQPRIEEYFLDANEADARNRAAEVAKEHGSCSMQSLMIERNLPYALPTYVTRIYRLDVWERGDNGVVTERRVNIF